METTLYYLWFLNKSVGGKAASSKRHENTQTTIDYGWHDSSIASFIFIYHYVSSPYHTVESHRNYTLVFTVADYNVGKAVLHQKDKETTKYMQTPMYRRP